jgi:hypothetical protein
VGAEKTRLRLIAGACNHRELTLPGRTKRTPVHELLSIEADQGLARRPRPSTGDIFLDLEGDPLDHHIWR